MKPPQIAIIGTEGSGKTVLTTVLAKKLATPVNGVWLNPQDAKTEKYVERTWNTLRRGKWVPSTPPGTLFELSWKLQAGELECPMRMVDSAGQDLRKLFSDDGWSDDSNISDHDRLFIDYIQNSTILLVLINLRDFLGEADEERHIENRVVIKGVLDKLKKGNGKRQIAFVFTAYDQYKASIKKRYDTVEKFVEKELTNLHNAHVAGKAVEFFSVAAVADTEERVLEDGATHPVPAPKFRSDGLEPLIEWLVKATNPKKKSRGLSGIIEWIFTRGKRIAKIKRAEKECESTRGKTKGKKERNARQHVACGNYSGSNHFYIHRLCSVDVTEKTIRKTHHKVLLRSLRSIVLYRWKLSDLVITGNQTASESVLRRCRDTTSAEYHSGDLTASTAGSPPIRAAQFTRNWRKY